MSDDVTGIVFPTPYGCIKATIADARTIYLRGQSGMAVHNPTINGCEVDVSGPLVLVDGVWWWKEDSTCNPTIRLYDEDWNVTPLSKVEYYEIAGKVWTAWTAFYPDNIDTIRHHVASIVKQKVRDLTEQVETMQWKLKMVLNQLNELDDMAL